GSRVGILMLSIIATVVVAVSFEPVRRRVERWINRLVYGRRASPYEVLAGLADRLAETESLQGVLDRMARLMANGTGAEQATVWLSDAGGLVVGAAWPATPPVVRVDSLDQMPGLICPVAHDDELVGALQVIKSHESPITPVEEHLIADLAGSAGLVLGNQRLNVALAARADELQASRRRLLTAEDTERRRLERDLHDGTQQEVVALSIHIRRLERLARDEGVNEVGDVLSGIAGDLEAAVDEIRSLARGLYPPLLESAGLEAAVRSHAQSSPIPVEVKSEMVGRHPKTVESAIYFVVAEVMTNAVKHSDSSRIEITLSDTDRQLMAEIADDGVGFDPRLTGDGHGLVNIRDRIEALGGEVHFESAVGAGTRVSARIPILE
ncbi:MAG TPA: sensor histidine kinase, partial [Acidimicrobiia bacterium]